MWFTSGSRYRWLPFFGGIRVVISSNVKDNLDIRRLLLEAKRSMVIALPLIGAQLLQMCNGLVDAVVAGRLGSAELAAGGIGAGIWFFTSLLCIGLMAGLSPALSELIGQGRRAAVGKEFRQGLWLGLFTGCFALALALLIVAAIGQSALQPELIPLIKKYLIGACWSLPAFAIVMACRNVCEATGVVKPVLLVQALGLLVNVVADLGFGLGWFGFPKLGLFGIGLATSSVMITMAIALLLFLRRDIFKRYQLLAAIEPPDWAHIKPMLVLAVPIYLALLFEAGLFVATALQMGMIGTLEAAGHYIAISIAGACYMLPLGLSFALTARVGRVYGRQSVSAIRLRIVSGLVITFIMASATALLLLIFRHQITGLYVDDVQVQAVAAQLLIFAAVFQIPDAAQCALLGLLRGLQDTRVPMLINLFAYWGVAFSVGYYSAHHLGWGATGLWGGLILGLTVSAVMLSIRLWMRMRQLHEAQLVTS